MEYHSDPITARKAALRARARSVLGQADPEQTASWGRAMAEYLTKRELWQQAGSVFCFVSTAREPSTRPLLELALAQGKTLCVPAPGRRASWRRCPSPA
ncbi:5-formyltetrahydrofolate cyclo-ligase [Gemmiger sp. An194]|uniref:5-formyltetrahydrofolate cyclo-ligase n=1 Tax=Gemmiger sp. An194 TaxID=1965582 RepID=UPI001302560C|nr:5-formyltetrahydrofolate cyclo-ligase [Gemmiger sp. An194]